jgi:hypothetical protein
MTRSFRKPLTIITIACLHGVLAACGGGGGSSPEPAADQPVTITVAGSNPVSTWNEVATTTINLPASVTGTPEEQRPNTAVDLATVHVAIYDAVMAIAGTHQPYAITPTVTTTGASQEAAVAAAAYRVLLGLFPSRTAQYQTAYDTFLASLPDGPAKTQGLAVGAEVAAGILALRANDGRSVVLAPYVPGSAPGQFRGTNPIGRPNAFIKPFALTTIDQFRAPGPPALSSAAYAADLNETKALGSATSSVRTTEETEVARFNAESSNTFWPRNLRTFAMTNRSVAEHALGRARRRPERLLRVQVRLSVLAPLERNHAGRHRRQRRHHRRCQLGSAPGHAEPPRVPRRALLHRWRAGRDAAHLFRYTQRHVRSHQHPHGHDAPLHDDSKPGRREPDRAHRRRHTLPHVNG